MSSIGSQIADELLFPLKQTFDAHGITPEYLAKKLKKELNAEKTVIQKVKGSADVPLTPTGKPKKGLQIIATTGLIETRYVDGNEGREYSDGETVLGIKMIDWSTRQKARMDAHKLSGHYPAEKYEHSMDVGMINAFIDGLPKDVADVVCSKLAEYISSQRNRKGA